MDEDDDVYEPPLLRASEANNVEVVQRLLEDGEDPDLLEYGRFDGFGVDDTPLHLAACHGHLPVALLLIHYGARVDLLDYDGQTPLHLAACVGHLQIVKLLVRHGADIDKRDDDKETPLRYAIHCSHYQMAEFLLDNGAQVDLEGDVGLPPLACVEPGQEMLLKLLLRRNASIAKAVPGLVSELVFWLDYSSRGQQRSILSLRDTPNEDNARARARARRARTHWEKLVLLLWYHVHGVDYEGPLPPRLDELQSDEEFLQAHRWMIHPLASLLHKGTGRLLKHFFEVYYGTGLAMEVCNRTKNIPLFTAIEAWSPQQQDSWDPEDIQRAVEGFGFLLDANPLALRVRHHKTRRFPLAAALDKGLPLRIIEKMVMLWPTAARLKDPVTGLYVSMLAATTGYYTVADVYWMSTTASGMFPQVVVERGK